MFIQVHTFYTAMLYLAITINKYILCCIYIVCYKISLRCTISCSQPTAAMKTVLLRLLPLLVVGCLLLQSLQPTAVSGQEICDQTIEGEAIAFEDYVWEYGKAKPKPAKSPKKTKEILKPTTSPKKKKPKAKKKKITVSFYSLRLMSIM